MKIIGCYIVKNEAEVLRRSLASINKQVDELVVIDRSDSGRCRKSRGENLSFSLAG